MFRTRPIRPTLRHPVSLVVATLGALTFLAACSGGGAVTSATAESTAATTAPSTDETTSESAVSEAASAVEDATALGAVGTLDSSMVHEISVTFDDADYDEMIATYASSQEKDWIEATVTIDGVTYDDVGIRLKGNSSLRGIAGDGGRGPAGDATAEDPASLPWLIKLDQFVDGQSHEGLTDLVVRSNNSETSLNEAVALELLDLAGLASQDAIATSFSVNGSDPVLRLVIEHPDETWMTEAFDAGGALYKAESTGDYSYRGDDEDSYDEVFDQEAGEDNADLTPLIEFLDFINNADDATFAAELGDRLDVDGLATYLAMQDLLDNFDDIDGPGNNSYLYWDAATGRFTVVPWDYNLAFGAMGGGPGGPGGPGGDPAGIPGDAATDVDDTGWQGGRAGGPGGPGGRSNILVQRFLADASWQALYQEKLTELRAALYASGVAEDVLAEWVAVVESSGLVDSATVAGEADSIAAAFA